jgi:hypothetical protein
MADAASAVGSLSDESGMGSKSTTPPEAKSGCGVQIVAKVLQEKADNIR